MADGFPTRHLAYAPHSTAASRRRLIPPGRIRAAWWLGLCLVVAPSAFAGGSSSTALTVREAVEVQSILTGEFGFPRPAGLTYVHEKRLLFLAQSQRTRTRLLRLTPFDGSRGVLDLPKLGRPSTLTFDPSRARAIAVSAARLTTIQSSSLESGRSGVSRVDITHLGLREPQAATFDTGDRRLLILDTAAQEIIRMPVKPGRGAPARVSLRKLGAQTLRGLAYNRSDRLVYVTAPDQGLLYGLDRAGQIRRIFSLRSAAFERLTGMVFAPSTDPTDSPSEQHLFAADRGGPNVLGRVVELSLARPISLPTTVTGRLVKTIHTSRLAPSVPDPSGIAYLPATDQLLVADSEVDELPIFRQANLFFMTRAGAPVETGTTTGFSREPTGVAANPDGSTVYITDDDKRMVFILRPGPDGRFGTQDDSVGRMSTPPFGSRDPEDVAFDPESGFLYVADGVAAEIYEVDPVNGVFGDGNDNVTHFDVKTYGVRNVEGLGFDPQRKTLLVVADQDRKILELTRSGGLVRIINVATIPGARWLAAVAVAPTSDPTDDPTAMSYWLADRGLDNDRFPNENDGRIYEVALP